MGLVVYLKSKVKHRMLLRSLCTIENKQNKNYASTISGKGLGAIFFTAFAIAAMCGGVVPQQPPSIFTQPSLAHSATMAAVCSGLSSYSPIALGRPALGYALT